MLLRKISEMINNIVRIFLFPLLLAMFTVVFIAVVLRIINISFISSYDISRLLFVWTTFLGMTVIYKKKGHMKFSFLYDRWEGQRKLALDLIIDLLIGAFFICLALFSLKLFPKILVQDLPGSGIPAIWLYLPFLIAPVIMSIHAASFLYEHGASMISHRRRVKCQS